MLHTCSMVGWSIASISNLGGHIHLGKYDALVAYISYRPPCRTICITHTEYTSLKCDSSKLNTTHAGAQVQILYMGRPRLL